MREAKTAADVEKALQHWTSSVIDPQLKPVQAKTRQLAEAALSLASSLEKRSRDITSTRDQIQERSQTLVENLMTLQNLENSRLQLGKEIHQLAYNEGSLLEAIERIESDSEIRTLSAKEAELKALRKRLLNEEMSRLGGVFTKVLSLHHRGEVHTHPQAIEVLRRYVKTPLTTR